MKAGSSSRYRVSPRLSWGLAATLVVVVVSGLVLAYPYREAFPFLSTLAIENVVPFGRLFRRIHYLSGLLFVVLLLWHGVEALLSESYQRRSWLRWTALTATLPLGLLLAFTGYVARGDETGRLAGYIAETLSLKIPFLGPLLNALFFGVREEGVHRAYLFHIYGTGALLLLSGIWHFRLRRLPLEDLLFWATLTLAAVPFLPLGLHGPGFHLLVKGPWFFVGIQEALRHLPPRLAGIVFPALGPMLYLGTKAWPRACGRALLLWTLLYGGLTVVGLVR
ncbi:cytochrome b N-terminal domain-containing protein [Thermosulfurimonas marina]|uniref:cytochrome b N-terminal domain-containing protein n=1 Tax=Thermosulfurimonas marina TaxID=2047767 RepID=UPI00144AB78F|nr:cytochrome b N-terminal domain-containing protein [Thermosulfurimonas marina]